MKKTQDVSIRQKLKVIENIERKCFSDAWSEAVIESMLKSEYDKVIIIEDFAYINYRVLYDEAELMKIAVLPEFRKKNHAVRLMELCIEDLRQRKVKSCMLELRASNEAALCLYKKFGFEILNVRKDYYAAPAEDALIMLLELGKEI